FIVRNYQADVIDAVRNLYSRRLAWFRPDEQGRMAMLRARRDADRVAEGYKGNPIGVPQFLLGGAVISAIAQGFRLISDAAVGSRATAVTVVVSTFAILAGAS